MARTLDAYLLTLPAAQQRALARLRRLIHAAAPDLDERFNFGIYTFCRGGMLVGISAAGSACTLYFFSSEPVRRFADELAPLRPRANAIRFQPDAPIPAALVKTIVKARIEELAEKR